MKAMLFIFEGYCEFEIAPAISILRDTYTIETISLEHGPCRSEAGLMTLPDLLIEEADPAAYDVLIIPGGDLRPIVEAEKLFDWVAGFSGRGKLVAAICSGGYVLAKAGLLENVPYTVTLSKEQREFLGCFNEEEYCYQPVVVHDNILTAQGHAYVEFALQLARMAGSVSDEKSAFYSGRQNVMME
ncbi:MAG TPA: DJ-1/PfpI family protein, partial [Bacillaceae bacterium]